MNKEGEINQGKYHKKGSLLAMAYWLLNQAYKV